VELLRVFSERSCSEETVENSDRSVWNDKTVALRVKESGFIVVSSGEELFLRFLIALQWLQISVTAPMHYFE
jgi:hypothetical protein